MENIFSKQQKTGSSTTQSNLLVGDIFKKVDPGNPFVQANEEMKTEDVRFEGDLDMDEGQLDAERPQLSFEITTCFKVAYKQEAKLSTGCKILNDFLRGGFLPRRIYEIYGESGTGKTQMAIQLLMNSVLPEKAGGLDGSALYIMAGKHLNEKRFSEMKDYFMAESYVSNVITENVLRDRISLTQAANLDEYNRIFINLSSRVASEQIKVVVVDNIHSVCDNFIKPDGGVDFFERSSFLNRHSRDLKRLAHQFNLVIVLLNNVVADVNQEAAGKGFFENRTLTRGQSIVPSLGLMWSNCINDRIALKKKTSNTGTDVKRLMIIEKSSYMRRNEIEFEIQGVGLRGKH